MNRIYLDNAASTQLRPAAMEAMRPYLTGFYGNPSSVHEEGRRARQAIEKAREEIASYVAADPEDVFFFPSATAANNFAVDLVSWASTVFLLSPLEHPSVYKAATKTKTPKMIPLDRYGRVTSSAVVDLTTDIWSNAAAVCWVCSETGVINPITDIATACDKHVVYLFTDVTQGICHLPIDFAQLPPDCITFGAHKFGGPRGIGVLVCYNKFLMKTYMDGDRRFLYGGHQERGVWPGTENTAAIVGAAAAMRDATENMEERIAKTLELRERMIERLSDLGPRILFNSPKSKDYCVPGIINVSVPGMTGADVVMQMDDLGVAVSSGSACSSGDKAPSPVIMAATKGDVERAESSVRFSFSDLNSLDEIDVAMDCFRTIVEDNAGK